MTSIIFTGADTVESVVIVTDKAVSSLWVFPYPILKRLFNHFLLCLCRCGFLMIEHRFFVSVFIIHIIKNTGIFQIQRVLNNTVGGSSFRTVSAVRLDIPVIGSFIFDKPIAIIWRITDFDPVSCVLRRG